MQHKLVRMACAVLFFATTVTQAAQINIYLKCDAQNLRQQVDKFNRYLQSTGLLKRYGIKPFAAHHPLHVTLYLAEFKEKNLDQLTTRVSRLARHWRPFELATENLHMTSDGHLLLYVDNPHQYQPDKLFELSNAVVRVLAPLRNRRARIPDWASHSPEKQKSFKYTGSPDTGSEFNPHISLLAKSFTSKHQQLQFEQRLQQLVAAYKKNNPEQILFEAASIGIGYADNQGQITHEIASFPLNGVVL